MNYELCIVNYELRITSSIYPFEQEKAKIIVTLHTKFLADAGALAGDVGDGIAEDIAHFLH